MSTKISDHNLNFYLGCAVWSYQNWVGNFYPTKSKPSEFLQLYSDRMNTVEGNTTFYAIPDENTLIKWTKETSSEFKFCLKFPQLITHQGLLQDKIDQALDFMQNMSLLERKLGVIFAQLPPSYTPNYLQDLTIFLKEISANKNIQLALEVRNIQWFEEPFFTQLNQLLETNAIAKVLLDTRPIYNCSDQPQINSQRPKPNLPLKPILTTDFTVIRFISHPQTNFNTIYLQEWLKQIKIWLEQKKTIYFFVHCPVEDYSPQHTRSFQQLLEENQINIPPLPWNNLKLPQQLSLF